MEFVMKATALLLTAAASLALVAQPAAARDDNPRAARDAAQTQSDPQDPDRVICVRTQLSGSRLMRRICRTAREWEEDGEIPGR
jgi:hypothetical protein